MDFRIADTFTASRARLTGDEQKAVKTTAFDLQLNPVGPDLSFHKLDRAKDKQFWSVRGFMPCPGWRESTSLTGAAPGYISNSRISDSSATSCVRKRPPSPPLTTRWS